MTRAAANGDDRIAQGDDPAGSDRALRERGDSTPQVLYLHGFRSSPRSYKAQAIEARMAALGLAARYACPQLPESPAAAVASITAAFALSHEVAVIGSSLGGFYATHLAERFGCRAVLLNPATDPAATLAAHLGTQTPWHGGEAFEFRPEYLDELRALEVGAITRPERYLLVAATGDEVLDWRQMVARYPGARHEIVQGSDHSLTGFERQLDDVLAFCGIDPRGRR